MELFVPYFFVANSLMRAGPPPPCCTGASTQVNPTLVAVEGYLCDRIEREWTIMAGHGCLALGVVLCTAAPAAYSPEMFFIGRFFSGVPIGVGCTIVPAYLTEFALPVRFHGVMSLPEQSLPGPNQIAQITLHVISTLANLSLQQIRKRTRKRLFRK